MNTSESPTQLLADGDEALIHAAFVTGDYTTAADKLGQASHLAHDPATEAAIADRLGWLLHFQALDNDRDTTRVDEELALFHRALDIRRSLGDLGGIAASTFGVGLAHQVLRGDWTTAIRNFEEALTLAEHTDLITRSEIHRHIGFYYLVENPNPASALEHLRISLDLRHQYQDKRWLPSGTQALGWAMLAAGHQDEAIRLQHQALDQARAIGLRATRIAGIEQSVRNAEAGIPG